MLDRLPARTQSLTLPPDEKPSLEPPDQPEPDEQERTPHPTARQAARRRLAKAADSPRRH